MADNTPRPRKNKLLRELEAHTPGSIVAPPLFRTRAEGRVPKSNSQGSKASNFGASTTGNSSQTEAPLLPDAPPSSGLKPIPALPLLPPQNSLQPNPSGLGSPSSSNIAHVGDTHHIPTSDLNPKSPIPQLLVLAYKTSSAALQAPESASDPSSQNRPSKKPSYSGSAPEISVVGTLDPSQSTSWSIPQNILGESQSKFPSSLTSAPESLDPTKPVSEPSSDSKLQKSKQKLPPSSVTGEIADASKPVPPYKSALSTPPTILSTKLLQPLGFKSKSSPATGSTPQKQEIKLPAPIPSSHAKLNNKSFSNLPKKMDVNDNAPHPNGHASISPSSQPIVAGAATTSGAALHASPTVPLTSSQDDGTARRPRDERVIAILLASLSVSDYQRRVPLQLLDFAYRHTSSILTDALHLSSDAYISQQTRARDAPPGGGFKDADGQVSNSAIQLAIQSRLQYQFSGGNGGGLSKEFLLEQAEARNKVALPRIAPNEWGVRLPSEKYVLSGVPWGMTTNEEQESDTTRDVDADVGMGMDGVADEMVEGEEEGGTAADLFGEDLEDENMGMED